MECWWYLVTILYVFAWTQASLLKECPPPEDSYPCYCEEDEDDEDRSIMHCNNLKESKQISTGLSRLTDYKISTVSIWFCDVEPTIKSDAFKGPVIDEITFSYSTVYVENPPFKGQENSLRKLTFLFCFDEEDFVNSWSLGHLNHLKEVSFEKNDIKVLKNDWLTSAGPNLRTVTFDNCKLEELEDKVFAKLEGLTTLFLMDNKITTLKRSMFPTPAENLRSISMSDNQIDSLPDDIFKDMPSLRTVEMERNKLKTLTESAWGSIIEDLSRVYLEDNPFRCDKSLKWISKKALPKTFTGACSEPSKLKNKSLRVLTPADFH